MDEKKLSEYWNHEEKWLFILVGILGSDLMLRRPDTNLAEILRYGLYQMDLARTEDKTIVVEYKGRVSRYNLRQYGMVRFRCNRLSAEDMMLFVNNN